MNIILAIVSFVVSLILLYTGSNKTVHTASKLAASLNFRKIIIGTIFVASVTSMPELLSSIIAVAYGSSDMALGNIIGSNVYNIPLIVGICGLIKEYKVKNDSIGNECLFMIGLSVILMLSVIIVGRITWWIGLIFLLLYPAFIGYSIYKGNGGSHSIDEKTINNTAKLIIALFLGGSTLLCGTFLLVYSAITICETFNLSRFYVGFTIMAIGCIVPEVAVSILAALHNEQEISMGNVIGDNIITMTLVLGIVAILKPFTVSQLEILSTVPLIIIITFILYVLNRRGFKISRAWSLLMLVLALVAFILETFNYII